MGRAKFTALETLRGVAALCVLLFHALGMVDQAHGGSGRALTHGYLAVDFFFMLSGFVMSAAYAERLAAGWRLRAFMERRLRRLYPVYAASLALGLAVQLGVAGMRHAPLGGPAAGALAVVTLFGALFLPLLSGAHAEAFPLNGVAWSLSHELLANLAYGRLRRPAGWLLGLASGAGAIGCLWLLRRDGSLQAGAMQDDYLPGLSRVLFAFPLGVLLHRAHRAGLTERLPRLGLLALAAGLAAPLALPLHHQVADGLVDGVCLFAVFPAVLALGARRSAASATGEALGALSYPIYAVHLVLRPLWLVLIPGLAPASGLALVLAGSLAMAMVVQRWLDAPSRLRLAPAP